MFDFLYNFKMKIEKSYILFQMPRKLSVCVLLSLDL